MHHTFTSKSLLKKTSHLTFFKGLTLFFLGASAVLLSAYGLNINPGLAGTAVQYLQKIVLTSDGTASGSTGVVLDGSGKISSSAYCDLNGACVTISQIGGANGEPLFLATSGLFAKQADTGTWNTAANRVAANSGNALHYPTSLAFDAVTRILTLSRNNASALTASLDDSSYRKSAGSSLYYASGNVGLGTSTPSEALEISGNLSLLSSNAFVGTKDANPLLFVTNNLERMRITSGGDVIFGSGTGSPFVRGNQTDIHFSTASTPDFTWYGDTNVGIFHPALDMLAFAASGVEKMRITTGGVAIGTTNAGGYALNVNGSLALSQNLVFVDNGVTKIIGFANTAGTNLQISAGDSTTTGGSISVVAGNGGDNYNGGNVGINGGNGYSAGDVYINGGNGINSSYGNVFLGNIQGNVAIGTGTAQAQKLYVEGEIKVTSGIILKITDTLGDGDSCVSADLGKMVYSNGYIFVCRFEGGVSKWRRLYYSCENSSC